MAKTKPAKAKPNVSKSTASSAASKAPASKIAAKAKSLKKQVKPEKKPVSKAPTKAPPKMAAKSADAKPKAAVKPEAPKKGAKKEKTKKAKTERDELDIEDDFDAEDFGASEIAEYEDDLKAVEAEDDESADTETWEEAELAKNPEEVILTDAEGNRYCRARDCDQITAVEAYCRYHYLLFWKKIQVRKEILKEGKLERYVEELTGRYPDKFLEMIRRDLRTEKDFVGAIQELEIDEAGLENEFEEDAQTFIDEVRGMGESTGVDEEEF